MGGWCLQAMLHHAESVIHNMGGLYGDGSAEDASPNKISMELLSNMSMEASLAAAFAARRASISPEDHRSTRVSQIHVSVHINTCHSRC